MPTALTPTLDKRTTLYLWGNGNVKRRYQGLMYKLAQ